MESENGYNRPEVDSFKTLTMHCYAYWSLIDIGS